MIELSKSTSFAEGDSRRCYVHPGDSGKCLKIVKANPRHKSRLRRFFRPRSWYDPNNIEHRAYRSANRLRDETVWRHIPRCYGFVETDLGRALSVEMMRDADGEISRPLLEFVADGLDDTLRAAYAELTDFYMRTGFYMKRINNILVVCEADGGKRLVLSEIKPRYPALIVVPFFCGHRRMRRKNFPAPDPA